MISLIWLSHLNEASLQDGVFPKSQKVSSGSRGRRGRFKKKKKKGQRKRLGDAGTDTPWVIEPRVHVITPKRKKNTVSNPRMALHDGKQTEEEGPLFIFF